MGSIPPRSIPTISPTATAANSTNVNGQFSIPIRAGYFTTQGAKSIGIQAMDAAGEKGILEPLTFVFDTTPPGSTPATQLDAGSDTGSSNSDGITNANGSIASPSNAPILDIGSVANPSQPGTVQLFRTSFDANGNPTGLPVLVNTVLSPSGGVIRVADITPTDPTMPAKGIADGTYLYTAILTDLAGNVGSDGPGRDGDDRHDGADGAGTVDRAEHQQRPPDLAAQLRRRHQYRARSASRGPSSRTRRWRCRSTARPAGTATADATGFYVVASTVPLTAGANNVTIIETDVAGNASATSTTLAAVLDTTAPPAITTTLDPRSDTGTFSNDNLTNLNTPTFIGHGRDQPLPQRQPDARGRTGHSSRSTRNSSRRWAGRPIRSSWRGRAWPTRSPASTRSRSGSTSIRSPPGR